MKIYDRSRIFCFLFKRSSAAEEVAAVADFAISAQEHAPWVAFIEWLNTRPGFIARWRADPELERRHYLRLAAAVADSRSAYAAALYHLERIRDLERRISDVLSRYDFSTSLSRGSFMALGRSRIADFEYHGFIFAFRRSLDYLAWGLSTYFDAKVSSFHQLGTRIGRWSPPAVAQALQDAYRRHEADFAFVMDKERGKSTRDRLAHRSFVQAFVINIFPNGFRLVGGGEALGMGARADDASFSQVLQARLATLHACMTDMLASFRRAVTAHEAGQTGSAPG